MEYVLEVIDESERKIHLTKKQWGHIRKKHPEVEDLEDLEQTLKMPLKITDYSVDESVRYYYKYFKHRPSSDNYLLVLVKYLNGDGYVITAYFTDKIK